MSEKSAMQQIELVHVNPAELVIDVNVRTVADLDREFVNSIREHGVLQPPTGWRDDAGTIMIEIGQRRSLAAAQLGLESIPVIIKSREEAEAEKLLVQLVENDRRKSLSHHDRAAAYQQLTLFGLKPDDIAKRTGAKRDSVRAAVKTLNETPEVLGVMREHPVPLDIAARLLEFSEHPDLLAVLSETVEHEPQMLEHEIHDARNTVKKRELHEVAVSELKAEGITLIDGVLESLEEPDWERLAPLDEVFLPGVPATQEIGLDVALAQGGLCAVLAWKLVLNSEGDWENAWDREYWVSRPREHGYVPFEEYDFGTEAQRKSPEENAREREKAKEKARELAEREAFERATVVRREWIRDVLLNKYRQLPANAGEVILDFTLGGGGSLPVHMKFPRSMIVATELLGHDASLAAKMPDIFTWGDKPRFNTIREQAKAIGHDRVMLGIALGHIERSIEVNMKKEAAKPYFMLLQSWGYGLSEAEQGVVDHTGIDSRHESDGE